MTDTAIAIAGVCKTFSGASQPALADLSLEIRKNEFFTLLGPSGCGKTTLLRMIAGFENPDAGSIELDGVAMGRTPPNQRPVNTVFQSYALFPHMTVFDNIAFALRIRKWSAAAIQARVQEVLGLVRLPHIERRYPSQLSGGQQQRVALARALVFNPRILLMDEALGALDVKLREHMQLEIKRIQQALNITTIHVTHDQEEALGMSDRIVVMHDGRIAQIDPPKVLYERPRTAYVADFVGKVNLLPARIVESGPAGTVLDLAAEALGPGAPRRVLASEASDPPVGTAARVGVRPEYMEIQREPSTENCVSGRILGSHFIGPLQYFTLEVAPGTSVLALDPTKSEPSGTVLYARWHPSKTLVLADD